MNINDTLNYTNKERIPLNFYFAPFLFEVQNSQKFKFRQKNAETISVNYSCLIVYVTRQVRCLFIIQKRTFFCFCSTVCMNKGTGRIFQSKRGTHAESVVDWTRRTFNRRCHLWLNFRGKPSLFIKCIYISVFVYVCVCCKWMLLMKKK